MREVDSSETSVVWPAWCYSGETTVNEDLPQATSAPSTERQQQQLQQHHRFQQSSSNQSQSSSASSSPSSAHSVAQGGVGGHHKSRVGRRGSFSSSSKRKSITPSSVSPGGVGNSALTAALGASSVAALAATAAAAAAAFQASPRRSTPPTTSLQLQLPENGTNGCRGSPLNPATTTTTSYEDPLNNNNNNNNNTSTSANFNSQVAALQSLDKMLSERIYDRKKYLNSPTSGSAAVAAFYEKFRNVAAATAGEVELNLINKNNNGQQSPGLGLASDLSAIGANHHHRGSGSGSASPSGGGPNGSNSGSVGNLTNGHHSASVVGEVGNGSSGNSLSNSNNQNSNGNNSGSSGNSNNINNSSSSSIGSTNNSNNNSIKSERFSPTNNDVQSTASRSRSVTPSSFSGTPPQSMHPSDVAFSSSISAVATSGLLPSPGNGTSGGRPEFQARNYSDFMRSLAAKYNNNNISNDQSSVKNPFLEPKMRINQPKSFIENSLVVGSKKGSPITSAQVPNPSIMSSLFPGLPFQSAVFPPLIDMSSTQALVALARAAKESGIANLLKPEDGGLKKPSAGSRSSSPPPGGSSSLAGHHFPSPFSASRYLPAGLLPNHLGVNYAPGAGSTSATTTAVPAISPLKSPSRTPSDGQLHLSSGTFPLDLSSAPSGAKRIKLSPTPSRNQDTSPAPSSTNSQPSDGELGKLPRKCHARLEEISSWTVDNVCDFVSSIDICAEYVQNFRDQSIDGAGLPLLTEEHLTNSLGMKLGPALKLKSMLAKRLGGPCPCALCAAAVAASSTAPQTPSSRMSQKGDTTPTNRPPSNGSVG